MNATAFSLMSTLIYTSITVIILMAIVAFISAFRTRVSTCPEDHPTQKASDTQLAEGVVHNGDTQYLLKSRYSRDYRSEIKLVSNERLGYRKYLATYRVTPVSVDPYAAYR